MFGYASAWLLPNPVSAGLIALGDSARWTIVAHHTLHRALDRLPDTPPAETSKALQSERERLVKLIRETNFKPGQ